MGSKEKPDELADQLHEAIPLDYSFKEFKNLELKTERPRGDRLGKIPNRGPEDRFITRSLWLSHNFLLNMRGLEKFINYMLERPSALAWLDLSFNRIREIDNVILKYPNLTILYFHGNNIENLETVLKLRELKKLKRLTLHGNPVTTMENYRSYVVHLIPQLNNLDFTPILEHEKLYPAPFGMQKKYGQFMT